MQTLTQRLIDANLQERFISAAQIKRLVTASDKSRYQLTHRAMRAGELLRIRRGLYVLDDRYRNTSVHPFALAQAIEPGSYVSVESALAQHGWVPEAVFTTTSILPGRKRKRFEHERFGQFTYDALPTKPHRFLDAVAYHQLEGQSFLLAKPLRALMDLVCLRRRNWQGLDEQDSTHKMMDWLEKGLRIDPDVWHRVSGTELRQLSDTYRSPEVRRFLATLQRAIGLEISS